MCSGTVGAKHEGDPLSGRNHILASLCPQVSGWVGQWVDGSVGGSVDGSVGGWVCA